MSKKISLTVNRSRFDIDLDETFAKYLQKQIEQDFNPEANNDIKLLLQAYVRKNYELFEQDNKIKILLVKISNVSFDTEKDGI